MMIRSLSTAQHHTTLAAPAHDADHGDHGEDSDGGGAGAGSLHSGGQVPPARRPGQSVSSVSASQDQ